MLTKHKFDIIYLLNLILNDSNKRKIYTVAKHKVVMSVADNIILKLIEKLSEEDIPAELITIIEEDWRKHNQLSPETIKKYLDDCYDDEN